MSKKEHIVRHTVEEMRSMTVRGESRSDWSRAGAMTSSDTEAAIATDADEADIAVDWLAASVTLPEPKAVLNMRVDRDVLDFFRKQGKGYQSRINAVLRSFVEHQAGR
jgi:uncharacterized protein (DUF4415 family)